MQECPSTRKCKKFIHQHDPLLNLDRQLLMWIFHTYLCQGTLASPKRN